MLNKLWQTIWMLPIGAFIENVKVKQITLVQLWWRMLQNNFISSEYHYIDTSFLIMSLVLSIALKIVDEDTIQSVFHL